MIPLIVSEPELELLEEWAREEAEAVLRDAGVELAYLVGTMIETPRAALVADEIAEVAEFFSFGTNDLTQMTFGFSRDDIEGRFMAEYLEHKLLAANPFETLDVEGVGQLVRMGCREGPRDARRPQARDLRRARWRSGVGRVLPRGRPRLRVVLAVPRADRPPRRRARRARHRRPRHHRLKPVWSAVPPTTTERQTAGREGDYVVTTDPDAVDLDVTTSFLATSRTGRRANARAGAIAVANSRCYTVLHEPTGAQVGGARAVTDFAYVRVDRRRVRRARGARRGARQVPDAVRRRRPRRGRATLPRHA